MYRLGDLRNCLNQLVTDPSIGSLLFEYRFAGRGELAGHNLGNLMLLALDNLCVRPLDAIKLISDMLKIESQLLPMSEFPTDLCAHTACGNQILGEVSIDQLDTPPLSLSLSPEVPATREAVQALAQADMIILGPGSFLTSIMPPCCWLRWPRPSTRAMPCCCSSAIWSPKTVLPASSACTINGAGWNHGSERGGSMPFWPPRGNIRQSWQVD